MINQTTIDAKQYTELSRFVSILKQRKPVATWSIVLMIGVLFGVELFLGGPTSFPVLVRMGALVPARFFEGEWWRLISCAFLHAGWWHVLPNAYGLIILGEFLERIIGSARFLVLYTISAIAGSIGSLFLLKVEMSVGASGALWGLLGAHAILAYRSRNLLPSALIPGAKRAAMINLAIGIGISFLPYVDMWAHFAGGCAGALLFASGLLTRTLPKLGEIEQIVSAQRDSVAARIPTTRAFGTAAALACLVLLSGPSGALMFGHPFDLTQAVTLAPTVLKDVGVSLDLPPGIQQGKTTTADSVEISFGDIFADPMVVNLLAIPLPPVDTDNLAAEIEDLGKKLAVPEASTIQSPPSVFKHGEDVGLTVSYVYQSGLVFERAYRVLKGKLIRVDVLRWPAHHHAAPEGLARRIAESAKLLGS